MSDDLMRDLARAVRLGDIEAADAALSAMDTYAVEIEQGRADAARKLRRDALPPLDADPLPSIAAYNQTPRQKLWDRPRLRPT